MSKEKPNMKLRMPGKDYTDPGYYFCTLVVEGRRHLLGCVVEVEETASGKQNQNTISGENENASVMPSDNGAYGNTMRTGVAASQLPEMPFGHSTPYKGACIAYTPFGQKVVRKIERIPFDDPSIEGKVEIKGKVVLPDHFHLLINIAERIEKPLGRILNGFNTGTRHEWKLMCFEQLPDEVKAQRITAERNDPRYMKPVELMLDGHWTMPDGQRVEPMPQPDGSLKIWEDGYNDQVVSRRGQMHGYYEYMRKNPWRLLLKMKYPDLFTKVWGKELMVGRRFDMVGNMFLLERPWRVQVRISRYATVKRGTLDPEHGTLNLGHGTLEAGCKMLDSGHPADVYGKTEYIYPKREKTEEEIQEAIQPFLAFARKGAVLVTPCISPAEKAVVEAAYNEGLPVIMFCPNGFSEGYHPSGQHYEACANGLLLQLAPWSYDPSRKLTKVMCEQLNNMAREFSK